MGNKTIEHFDKMINLAKLNMAKNDIEFFEHCWDGGISREEALEQLKQLRVEGYFKESVQIDIVEDALFYTELRTETKRSNKQSEKYQTIEKAIKIVLKIINGETV